MAPGLGACFGWKGGLGFKADLGRANIFYRRSVKRSQESEKESAMVTRRAECSCGQLSAICSGEPIRISVCHCLACKRRTGSAFSYNARFAEGDVTIQGRAAEFTRIGDEGGRVTYSFCPDCGTTVHYRIDDQPGLVAIPAGAFADPSFPPPFLSFYHESRRCQWAEVRAEPLQTFG
jgi:hypothetical protein